MPTVLEIIQSSTGWLEKHGVENARLNTEHLLAHALDKRRLELYLEFDRPLFEPQLAPMRELVRRRAKGEPLQHLLGSVEFLGQTFLCDSRALIPRPETERLVELLIAECQAAPPGTILDLGVGSGVIAASLALAFPNAQVTGGDLSTDALALAAENLERLQLRDRVALVESDGFTNIAGTFDLIVSNPPYLARETIPALAREVQWDPVVALDGGASGSEFPVRLIGEAGQHLTPKGMLVLEIGDTQSALLQEQLLAHGYASIRALRDYQGTERYLFATYG